VVGHADLAAVPALLGVEVEPDGGLRLALFTCGLPAASGTLPLPGGGVLDVRWQRARRGGLDRAGRPAAGAAARRDTYRAEAGDVISLLAAP
jgi:hypothetical protein